tara:strand:- start:1067 stop:1270 length:204 start_codon:yes stop_codon:yes gene_type:complete
MIVLEEETLEDSRVEDNRVEEGSGLQGIIGEEALEGILNKFYILVYSKKSSDRSNNMVCISFGQYSS